MVHSPARPTDALREDLGPDADGEPTDEFYLALAAACRGEPIPDTPSEPPLFADQPHWEAWREDQVFLARPPAPLPKRMPAAMPVTAPSASPGTELSPFRRLLAPVIITSTLALAALTHNAVADRTGRAGVPASTTLAAASPFEAPFSLTGAWRRIEPLTEIELQPPQAAPLITEPTVEPDAAPPAPVETPPPARPEAQRAINPAAVDKSQDSGIVTAAIDAICAIPEVARPQAEAVEAPARVLEPHHPSQLIATPLTTLHASEPWYVARPQPVAMVPASVLPQAHRGVINGMQSAARAVSKVTPTAARPSRPVYEPDPEPRAPKPAPKPDNGSGGDTEGGARRSFESMAKDAP